MGLPRRKTRQIESDRFRRGLIVGMMKTSLALVVVFLSVAFSWAEPANNHLTGKEKTDGWKLLFDGKSFEGWRGYQLDVAHPGWDVQDGCLVLTPTKGMADLLTTKEYSDFELVAEWQISEGGNSGILFRASEDNQKVWHSAVEIQVLDNEFHLNKKTNEMATVKLTHAAGAIYSLYPAKTKSFRERGAWNETRIVANGTKVVVYHNGTKVGSYDTNAADFKKRVANSKFNKYPGFGTLPEGHIVLQAHGDAVKYRNLKLRKL